MTDTPYATVLRLAEDAAGQRIERLYAKGTAREEIRFSWWKDGRFMPRPLDLPENELLVLMSAATENGVFEDEFLIGLRSAIGGQLDRVGSRVSLTRSSGAGSGQLDTNRAKTLNLLDVLDWLEPIDEEWPDIDDPLPEPFDL